MSEIPADVMKAAEAALSAAWDDGLWQRIVRHSAAAILAERERCAKIADAMEQESTAPTAWDAGYRMALDAVAAAIREPQP